MSYNSEIPWPYSMRMRTVSATATATADDQMITKTATSTITIWLPTAVGIAGKQFVLNNAGTGTWVIDPDGAQTINGAATDTVGVNQSKTIISNGVGWYII